MLLTAMNDEENTDNEEGASGAEALTINTAPSTGRVQMMEVQDTDGGKC